MSTEDRAQSDRKVAQDGIDRIAELVAEKYPKGTQDTLGKALRHELHKLGRLNEPKYEYIVLVPIGVKPGSAHKSAFGALGSVKAFIASHLADSKLAVLDGGDFIAFGEKVTDPKVAYLSQKVTADRVQIGPMGNTYEQFKQDVAGYDTDTEF